MAFGGFNPQEAAPVAEMNIIPLVDILLVLLVIFIVTAPILTHAVKIDLPQASQEQPPAKTQSIQLAIDAQGQLHWDDLPITEMDLAARLQTAVAAQPGAELHLRADRQTPYEVLARIMACAQRQHIQQIVFVTRQEAP